MKKVTFLILLLSVVSLSGCGSAPVDTPYKVNLEIWGTIDDSDAYSEVINQYRTVNANHVGTIMYRKLPAETYKDDLLRAFAEGKGPDLFFVRNAWLPDFASLIVSAPEYQVTEGGYRSVFTDAVTHDFVAGGKVYGAPLSTDSLALYYNKDIFNAAGIANPPATWDEVIRMAQIFNRIDTYGTVTQSGIAIGTSSNINRSTDILLALALQLGAGERSGRKPLQDTFDFTGGGAEKALSFYSQFAEVGSAYYSWNSRLHYSTDAFYEGTLAMMVNYSWKVEELKRKNAKLNFGVAPLPQFPGKTPANFSNYWGLVVAKNKTLTLAGGKNPTVPVAQYNDIRTHESWQFLHYLAFPHPGNTLAIRNFLSRTSTTVPLTIDPAKTYLEKTGQPAARRDLIEREKTTASSLAPFAAGNLIAKSYRSGEPEKVEAVLAQAIDAVNLGKSDPAGALQYVNSQIMNITGK
jgi:ABC-type glycerol-3-phosphate transport system substrate-binding protein